MIKRVPIIGVAVMAIVAYQNPVLAGHTHASHESHPNYSRTSPYTGTPTSTPVGPTVQVIYEVDFINCSCQTNNITINTTSQLTHTVTVVAGASASAKTSFMLKLIVEAAFNCSVTGTWTDTKQETISITENTTNPKCNAKKYKVSKDLWTSSGTVMSADCEYYDSTHGWAYCNQASSSGSGSGYKHEVRIWLPLNINDYCPTCAQTCSGGGG